MQSSNDTLWFMLGGEDGRMHATFTWKNVFVATFFILVNVAISVWLGLKLTRPLLISSARCLIQLIMMGYILQAVFTSRNPYYVALMTIVLILLSTYETVYNKSDRMWGSMFMSTLVSLGFSNVIIAVIGTKYAMRQTPFWYPETFIPSLGLLLGITASSMAVALDSCLTEMTTNQGRVETFLAYGGTRYEAGRSIAIEAVRLSMLPTINRMSIVGFITIPGTMTGQILSGAPIMNAVRYQEVITFMISASSGLAVLGVVAMCMHAVIDSRHRLRTERIKRVPSFLTHMRMLLFPNKSKDKHKRHGERQPLLGS